MPDSDARYSAMPSSTKVSSTTIAGLAAVGFVSGLANGFNGTLLEGAIPRMFATHVLQSSVEAGFLGGALSLGGFIGSLACTELAYRLSRRSIVVLGETLIILGVALFALAPTFSVVLTGRTICGFGVGICGLAKPLIVSELAPSDMRGMLVSLFAVGQSVGLNVFYLADFLLPPVEVGWAWRVLAAIGASPAVVVVGLALLTPASTYWDVPPSEPSPTRPKLPGLPGPGLSGPPGLGRQPTLGTARSADSPLEQLVVLLTREPWETRRNFGLVCALMLGYNLSGTLIISNYASQIFAEIHVADRALPIAIGVVQFLGLVSAAAGTDRLGRRPLLLVSCALTAASLFAIAALLGSGAAAADALGAALTPLLLALMIIVEYAVGFGLNPIRIVLSAELMPTRYRSLGMSLGNAVGWGLALVSLFFFPILSALAGGPAPQFAFFGAVVTALTALLCYQLPETKGIDFD